MKCGGLMTSKEDEPIFTSSCELSGNTIYCSIQTELKNVEFAFYIEINGVRKEQFWYAKQHKIEYHSDEEFIHTFTVYFFIRDSTGKITSEIIAKRSHWSLCDGVLSSAELLTGKNSNILEFGSGNGSRILSEHSNVYSVEHDVKFVNMFENVNYIHAPLVNIKPINGFNEMKWYDIGCIKRLIPKNIDLIIVDGPPEKYGRSGLLNHLDMFSENTIWIIDDVLREKDQKLANNIAFHFSMIQYRFWNYSILSLKPIPSEIIETFRDKAKKVAALESPKYIQQYYVSNQKLD